MRRIINKRIRRQGKGLNLAADINAVISTGEKPGEASKTESKSHVRVVQSSRAGNQEKEDR